MNKLQFNRMATTVLFAVLVLVSSVALAQKPIRRPPKKVRQTTTQQVAKPPKKTVAPAETPILEIDTLCIVDLPTTGELNGHEWVDLGLSVKWATTNIGAGSPNYWGAYFAWGETFRKSEYSDENSETMGKDLPDISANEKYDAARVYWGGSWRMPKSVEFKELSKKCNWVWTTINDVNGYTIYGPNGNSIFLPAAGGRKGGETLEKNQEGLYWCSTPFDSGNTTESEAFIFYKGHSEFEDIERCVGLPIRPVTE